MCASNDLLCSAADMNLCSLNMSGDGYGFDSMLDLYVQDFPGGRDTPIEHNRYNQPGCYQDPEPAWSQQPSSSWPPGGSSVESGLAHFAEQQPKYKRQRQQFDEPRSTGQRTRRSPAGLQRRTSNSDDDDESVSVKEKNRLAQQVTLAQFKCYYVLNVHMSKFFGRPLIFYLMGAAEISSEAETKIGGMRACPCGGHHRAECVESGKGKPAEPRERFGELPYPCRTNGTGRPC